MCIRDRVTAKKMHTLGMHNGAELRDCSLEMLSRQFGKAGSLYYECARGIDLRPDVYKRQEIMGVTERLRT